jgi:protein-disulfide isomerase
MGDAPKSTEKWLNYVLTLAAVIMAGSIVFDSLRGARSDSRRAEPAAKRVDDWRAAEKHGFRIAGSESSKAKMIVVGDLECPACRGFHTHLAKLSDKYKSDLSIVYVMMPMNYHRFARRAADATECIERFSPHITSKWIEVVLDKQDSLGIKPWRSYALDAGARITDSLSGCLASQKSAERVDSSIAWTARVGIEETPTIVINGWKLGTVKSFASLDSTLVTLGNLSAR